MSIDAVRLRQVLINLISNAVRYGDKKPVIIDLTAKGSFFTITITDKGPGIPSEDSDRIFSPYIQLKDGDRKHGTGLGLTIVQTMITAMQGHIDIDSEEGEGTSFICTLPLVAAENPNPNTPQAATPQSGSKILIVDDNELNREILTSMLETIQLHSMEVASGNDALEAVAAHQFAAILLDYNLPDTNGAIICEQIRQITSYASIPIITITGDQSEETKQRCLQAGASTVLTKPLRLKTITAEMQRYGIGEGGAQT